MSAALARKIDSIREKGAIRNSDLANLLSTRPETISRWNKGHAYPQPGKEQLLLQLEYIVDELSEIYEPNEARQWIFSPQRNLGGKSPAELIQNGKIEEVRNFVNQMREAVYL